MTSNFVTVLNSQESPQIVQIVSVYLISPNKSILGQVFSEQKADIHAIHSQEHRS